MGNKPARPVRVDAEPQLSKDHQVRKLSLRCCQFHLPSSGYTRFFPGSSSIRAYGTTSRPSRLCWHIEDSWCQGVGCCQTRGCVICRSQSAGFHRTAFHWQFVRCGRVGPSITSLRWLLPHETRVLSDRTQHIALCQRCSQHHMSCTGRKQAGTRMWVAVMRGQWRWRLRYEM